MWADAIGASQQEFSYALGHGERVDNFTGINLPLTGTVACSEAFSPSIVHLMNVSSFNSNLCIHTKKSFFHSAYQTSRVSFVQVVI